MSATSPPSGPRHPYALWSMLLGVAGLVPCCAPVAVWAWLWGNRAIAAIDSGDRRWSGREMAATGRVLGIVGTVLFIVWAVLVGFAYTRVR